MDKFNPFEFLSKGSKKIYFKQPKVEHAQDAIDFFLRAFRESPYILSRIEEFTKTVKQEEEWLKKSEEDPGQFTISAWYHGEIIGFLNFMSSHKKARSRHQGEFGISIDPRFRGEGIGRRLIEALIRWAQRPESHIRKINLGVVDENLPAHALYKSLGFKQEGRLKDNIRLDNGHFADELRLALFT